MVDQDEIVKRANDGDEYFINLAKLIQLYTTDLLSKKDSTSYRLIGIRSIQEYVKPLKDKGVEINEKIINESTKTKRKNPEPTVKESIFRIVKIDDDLTTYISKAGGRKRKHTKRRKSKRRRTRRR